jgi:hypothetical protein
MRRRSASLASKAARLTPWRGRTKKTEVATFADVFGYTLWAQAARRTSFSDVGASPFPEPAASKIEVSDFLARFLPVWHFDHDAKGSPATIRNLTCLARGMGNGRMTVADAITLEKAAIKTADGTDIDLPLDPSFVVTPGYLKKSHLVAGANFLYPLETEIDVSMAVTFGYEFKSGPRAKPVKFSDASMDSTEFMPAPGATQKPPNVGAGQRAKVVVAPLRVIVCFSFVTAKERADFEPGELLGAGRVWPHVLIMANRDLQECSTTVHVQRPANFNMIGGDHTKHADMNNAIESALFADHNAPPHKTFGNPEPYWSNLFAAYDVAVTSGTIRAVDPLEKGGAVAGAVQVLGDDKTTYLPVAVAREPHQGAYDNVHTAPTMRSSALTPPASFFLDRIYMAPFCEHDCLHTHWRWSRDNTKPSVFGWADGQQDPRVPGTPYKQAGSPMVPSNQTVNLISTGPSSFRYQAKAVGVDGVDASSRIPAGTFSIFFHHGMAYAIQLDSILINALDLKIDKDAAFEPGLGLPPAGFAVTSTPVRYWRLRFGGTTTAIRERLKVVDRPKLLARASP